MSCFQNQIASLNNEVEETNGIVKILQTILNAQMLAEYNEEEEEFCDRTVLGPCTKQPNCNTRPVSLFTCGGDPVSMEYTTSEGATETTTVFRIEKIDGDVCTFRCLAPNPNRECSYPYVKTNTFFSVNEGCCCHMLKCLSDTYVDCL